MPKTEDGSDRESVRVTLIRSTDMAWLVSVDGSVKEVWIPQSQCDLVPKNARRGDSCWAMIPQWILDRSF